MRVLHVTRDIDPASGGPSRSVQGLVASLNKNGVEAWLLTTRRGDLPWIDGVVHFLNGEPVKRSIVAVKPDIVHIHGLWTWSLHRCAKTCRRFNIPYLVSPRGMLSPWALREKEVKKRLAMLLYQRRDLKHAAVLHATAKDEARHFRELGFDQEIIVVPNGVTIPDNILPKSGNRNKTRIALFLSRLHPGKGLLTLAEAWSRIKPVGWRMKVVGPDIYGHKKDVVGYLIEKGISDEWEFIDTVDDVKKWEVYRSADFLVHPSISENFGITIAEALAAELPVICTKGTPWRDLEEQRCGWWVDTGVVPLANALRIAMSITDDERLEMGMRGRRLIEKKYTWHTSTLPIVKAYASLFDPSITASGV